MEIKTNFTSIQDDNVYLYLRLVYCAIQHSDPEAIVAVNKIETSLRTIITPSVNDFKESIIQDIVGMHRILKIKPDFSKSSKIQKIITYSVEF